MTSTGICDIIDIPLKRGFICVEKYYAPPSAVLRRYFAERMKEMRVKITLACTECKQRNYDTMKNKKNDPDRLEMNKYCRFCKKHTLHKETK